jgi:hypothetical protein
MAEPNDDGSKKWQIRGNVSFSPIDPEIMAQMPETSKTFLDYTFWDFLRDILKGKISLFGD